MIDRRTLLAAGLAALMPLEGPAADPWPTRPIKMVVPFAPGGATDIGARVLADDLSKELGQPVVVDNRSGAGGNIGAELAAQAPADGYTLLMATQAITTFNPHLYTKLKFDPRHDLAPVGMAFATDMVLVASPKLGASTLREVIALIKAKPGQLNFGSAGNGSAAHVLFELFKSMAQLDIQHVPYRGTGPALSDLVSGSLDMMIDSVPSALGQIKGGGVRAIAICGPRRNPRIPDVPTFTEAGLPDYSAAAWLAVFAPVRTPPEIVEKVNAAMKRVLARPESVARAAQAGLDAEWSSAADLAARIRADSDLWGRVIRQAGIKLD